MTAPDVRDASIVVSTIVVVPDLEVGNTAAEHWICFTGADAAGIMVGARVRNIMTSGAAGGLVRPAWRALANGVVHHPRQNIR